MKKNKKKRASSWGYAGAALAVLVGVAVLLSAVTAPPGETWGEWVTAWTTVRPPEQPTPPGKTPTWGEWARDTYNSTTAAIGGLWSSVTGAAGAPPESP